MERRKFLGVALSTVGIPIVAEGSSLYGTPMSVTGPAEVDDVLSLSLSRAAVSPEAWGDIGVLKNLWQNVLFDQNEARAFSENPSVYLAAKGLPPSLLSGSDPETLMLKAVTDHTIKELILKRDYGGFLSQLRSLGILQSSGKSGLKARLKEVMAKDAAGLRNAFDKLNKLSPEEIKRMTAGDEFALLYSIISRNGVDGHISESTTEVAAICCAVAIFAVVIVEAAISIYLAVTVFSALAIDAQVVVYTSVFVDGATSASKLNFPVGKFTAGLAPQYLRDVQRAARVSQLLGSDQFAFEGYRKLICDEIDSVMEVSEELGMLNLQPAVRVSFSDATKRLAIRVAFGEA